MHCVFIFIIMLLVPSPILSSSSFLEYIQKRVQYYEEKINEKNGEIDAILSKKQGLLGISDLVEHMIKDLNNFTDTEWDRIQADVESLLIQTTDSSQEVTMIEKYPIDNIDHLFEQWAKTYKVPKDKFDLLKEYLEGKGKLGRVVKDEKFAELIDEYTVLVGKIGIYKRVDNTHADLAISTHTFKFRLPLKRVRTVDVFNKECHRCYWFWKCCESSHSVEFEFKGGKFKDRKKLIDLSNWLEHDLIVRFKNQFGYLVEKNEKTKIELEKQGDDLRNRAKEYEELQEKWMNLLFNPSFASEQGKGDIRSLF